MSTDHASRPHDDPGLQPERTLLAWGRTIISFLVVDAVFLRWLPHYGLPAAIVVAAAAAVAAGICAGQRRRYRTQATGLATGAVHADAAGVLSLAGSVVALGSCGIWSVLGT